MDFVAYQMIKDETRIKVEKELGRKLTDGEIEVFNKTSRITMMNCEKIKNRG